MSVVLIVLGILGLIVLLGVGLWLINRFDGDELRAEVWQRQRAIDADHEAARRAMNEAAGQSWRNLAG